MNPYLSLMIWDAPSFRTWIRTFNPYSWNSQKNEVSLVHGRVWTPDILILRRLCYNLPQFFFQVSSFSLRRSRPTTSTSSSSTTFSRRTSRPHRTTRSWWARLRTRPRSVRQSKLCRHRRVMQGMSLGPRSCRIRQPRRRRSRIRAFTASLSLIPVLQRSTSSTPQLLGPRWPLHRRLQ